MKKLILSALVLCLIASLSFATVKDMGRERDFTVTANSSTATMAGGWLPGRQYYIVINESADYIVRHATYNITGAEAINSTSRGIPIGVNLGFWEDKYNVHQSSWYVIISSANGSATTAPISATVTYRERD